MFDKKNRTISLKEKFLKDLVMKKMSTWDA